MDVQRVVRGSFVALSLALAGRASAEAERTLTPPTSLTAQALAGGEHQRFQVEVKAGDVLQGVVLQRGIDVVVTLNGPQGERLLSVDSPNGPDGPEPLLFVARMSGVHVVEISAFQAKAAGATYDLTLDALRPATSRDRELEAAVRLQAQGQQKRDAALALQGKGQGVSALPLYREAERSTLQALKLRERHLGKNHTEVAASHELLGLVYDEIGDYARGERHFAEALAILQRVLGPENPGVLGVAIDLGYLRLGTGNYQGAVDVLTPALEARKHLYGPDDPRLVNGLSGLGTSLLELGRLEAAEATLKRGLALREKADASGLAPIDSFTTGLGLVLLAGNRLAEAEASCARSRNLLEMAETTTGTRLASALSCLGKVKVAQGDSAAALPLLAEALRLRSDAGGPQHPSTKKAQADHDRVAAQQEDRADHSRPERAQLTLRSRAFRNTRQLRVLLPPGYGDPRNANRRYPVFYFFDGIAAFDAWGVPPVAQELWSRAAIPEMLFVGIDNGGSTRESKNPVSDRAGEYLPYRDQSWTTPDAPTPRGELLPRFLFDEVMPLVNQRYRTITDPGATGLAGDSFAAVGALSIGLKHPERLGWLLLESPSLHIGDGRLLREAKDAARWPPAVYVGVGTKEGEEAGTQQEMLANARELCASLEARGSGPRVHLEVTPEAEHGYDAWRKRLPAALRWLLSADTAR